MKPFKFFRGDNTLNLVEMVSEEVQRIARSPEHIPAGYINAPYIPLQITEPRGINACIMEGYRANRDNLPPGQCPYDIGTLEREHWMTGWSSRENREPQPIEPDERYVELTDTDTGGNFGIPASMYSEISYRGKVLYEQSRTVSGRCGRGPYEYWIDNVYSTLENTLVISVTVSVPFGAGNGRVTFHKFRQIVPYETV